MGMGNEQYDYYCGIDCGFTGYAVILNEHGKYVEHFKLPTIVNRKETHKRSGKIVTKTNTSLDEVAIYEWFRKWSPVKICVGIEKQHPMAKQGLGSTSKIMYGFGWLSGLIRGLGLPCNVFRAVDWQKELLPPKSEDTKAASVASIKAWDKDIDLKRTKRSQIDDHNLADALNIARFTWLKFGTMGGQNGIK